MNGYPTPNHTQVPNMLFETDMADMSEAELKCTLAIVRKILGYHKTEPEPISYSQIQTMTGLSRQAVSDGIQAAINRGRIIQTGKGKRGVNLFTVYFVDQSTQETSQGNSTSLSNRPELVNEVDTQKKAFKESKDSDAPSGGQVAIEKSKREQKPKPRDPIFDVIADKGFGFPVGTPNIPGGGRIAKLATYCKGNDVKPRRNAPKAEIVCGLEPPATADELAHFYNDQDGYAARDIVKFAEQFQSWRIKRQRPITVSIPPQPQPGEDIHGSADDYMRFDENGHYIGGGS